MALNADLPSTGLADHAVVEYVLSDDWKTIYLYQLMPDGGLQGKEVVCEEWELRNTALEMVHSTTFHISTAAWDTGMLQNKDLDTPVLQLVPSKPIPPPPTWSDLLHSVKLSHRAPFGFQPEADPQNDWSVLLGEYWGFLSHRDNFLIICRRKRLHPPSYSVRQPRIQKGEDPASRIDRIRPLKPLKFTRIRSEVSRDSAESSDWGSESSEGPLQDRAFVFRRASGAPDEGGLPFDSGSSDGLPPANDFDSASEPASPGGNTSLSDSGSWDRNQSHSHHDSEMDDMQSLSKIGSGESGRSNSGETSASSGSTLSSSQSRWAISFNERLRTYEFLQSSGNEDHHNEIMAHGEKVCDECDQPISHWLHCFECENSHYDVCLPCVDKGWWCLDKSHEMLEADEKGPIIMRRFSAWAFTNELRVYDLKDDGIHNCLLEFSAEREDPLHESQPALHPSAPIFAWPLSPTKLLLASMEGDKERVIQRMSPFTKHGRKIDIQVRFSDSGSHLLVASIEAVKAKGEAQEEIYNLHMQVAVLQLRFDGLILTQPVPICERHHNLRIEVPSNLDTIPFVWTWTANEVCLTVTTDHISLWRVKFNPSGQGRLYIGSVHFSTAQIPSQYRETPCKAQLIFVGGRSIPVVTLAPLYVRRESESPPICYIEADTPWSACDEEIDPDHINVEVPPVMESYPYRPINLPHETRILTVQPGKLDDDIICGLSHVNITSPGEPYEALSYCWSKSVECDIFSNPDTEIPFGIYGKDETGEIVSRGGKMSWKDMLYDPHLEEHYIRMGGKMPDGSIKCDGVTMVVGGQLFRALRRLRPLYGPPLRIWVDALCINQQDITERNEYVKIMGQVYAGALRTRVWLGESTGWDVYALQTLSAINKALDDIHAEKTSSLPGGPTYQQFLQHVRRQLSQTADMDRLEWGLLSELLDRAWFKRTWIIQEVANSKDIQVHVGGLKFPWTLLWNAVGSISGYKINDTITESKGFKSINIMENLRIERVSLTRSNTSIPFLDLLEELRDLKATIPSDKIYGILGLTNKKDDIAVDYAQSSEKVFTDITINELESGSLDILSHCVKSSKPTTLTLPSWVPNWTCPGWTEPLRTRKLKMAASGSLKPELAVDKSRGILQIKGRILDKVAAVEKKRQISAPGDAGPFVKPDVKAGDEGFAQYGDPILDTEDKYGASFPTSYAGWKKVDDEFFESRGSEDKSEKLFTIKSAKDRRDNTVKKIREHTKTWHQGVFDVAFPDKTVNRQTWEDLWRTFMCNRTYDNNERPDHDCSIGFDRHMQGVFKNEGLEDFLQEHLNDRVENHGASRRDVDEYLHMEKEPVATFSGAHEHWTYNRRFFRSEAGRFGWCVDGTEPGDIVALFHGCDSVFVLRDAGSGKWRIIGDCYIHGLMDGEGCEPEFEQIVFHNI